VTEKGDGTTTIQGGAGCTILSRGLEQEDSHCEGCSRKVWNTTNIAECLPFLKIRCMSIEGAGFANKIEQVQEARGEKMGLRKCAQHMKSTCIYHVGGRHLERSCWVCTSAEKQRFAFPKSRHRGSSNNTRRADTLDSNSHGAQGQDRARKW
jgi:hypothetical protein